MCILWWKCNFYICTCCQTCWDNRPLYENSIFYLQEKRKCSTLFNYLVDFVLLFFSPFWRDLVLEKQRRVKGMPTITIFFFEKERKKERNWLPTELKNITLTIELSHHNLSVHWQLKCIDNWRRDGYEGQASHSTVLSWVPKQPWMASQRDWL